ncbi:MAG: ATP phosphoribosyltransferase regulatory subunit [Nitrospira sp.]|nr:ATP phosphoribosyltransferase regulatory subunit [Nitrospira sp.]MCP9464691.1 ATP phosphoribosyltransferase regulatory subunit [Nitrospira sp.]
MPLLREHSLVPPGMATILPEAAGRFRKIETQLIETLAGRGFQEIILPTFEYLDVLAPGLESELIEKCYKIPDRTTGRILLLRPDATAQIARTVAMGMMGERIPMKLSYRTTVFRYEPEHAGRDREIFQVGAELIGVDDAAADQEIVSCLIACLRRIGVRSFKVSIGHVGFFKRLLVQAGLSEGGRKQAEQAAARKDIPRLEEILRSERIAPRAVRRILGALELAGTAEVIAQGRELAGRDRSLHRTLDRLSQVYHALCRDGYRAMLFLDLGEFRGFDYYDGLVFDVFAEGIGGELGGGGRYNHLIGRFGRNLPSTGFALIVDRLFQARGISRGLSAWSKKPS